MVILTAGSMVSTITAVLDKATGLAINLRVKNSDVDFQFAYVCYRV
jgi:hypothetical protein